MSTYEVTRKAIIPAEPGEVFPLVNSFRAWTEWSPWEGMDPAMDRVYSGSESGVGAKYAWSGNRKAGAGTMEIIESVEPGTVRIRLEFTKPFTSVSPTVFTFAPSGSWTEVTWTMTGENKGIGRVFALFMNMDKMIGRDFEKGLASLRAAVARRQA